MQRSQNDQSPAKIEELYSSTQQKSFESIMRVPYQQKHPVYTNDARSIESPYTSLGSCRSSYASIKPNSYSSLRARSLKANAQHESKSKAVMQALQNLQDKIGALEVDRAKAENNLKSLTVETTEYKELLKQKHDLSTTSTVGSPCSSKHGSHTEELGNQLENAQHRCETLEKQLDYMRKMMQTQTTTAGNTKPPLSTPTTPNNRRTFHSPPATNDRAILSDLHDNPLLLSPARRIQLSAVQESPALEKLNGLEKEHLKLTASQSQAENKIRQLEEKIREESHCRKLLEDKAYELEQVVAQANLIDHKDPGATTNTGLKPTKTVKKKRKKKIIAKAPTTSSSSSTTPRSPRCQSTGPSTSPNNHYLLDLNNIPFVVGQSTSRSHSVGANVQNVLSMMKSHSRLCESANHAKKPNTSSARSKRPTPRTPRSPKSTSELEFLLRTLSEEFEELVEEHRQLSERIEVEENELLRQSDEKELSLIYNKLESKGKQISMIREVLKSSPQSKVAPTAASKQHTSSGKLRLGPQEIEVVTTIRAPTKTSTARSETKGNTNLDLLKKVRKLQYTLQKEDLKWD
ncbi:centrosomal protein of 57 kDa-like [Clytia hemisphaerica]|uniref:centrosomal protein of 57 kDa-like n=1 Tax=Clytia hemisphaerica TaxID=252671 RepID=UPI0034D7491C